MSGSDGRDSDDQVENDPVGNDPGGNGPVGNDPGGNSQMGSDPGSNPRTAGEPVGVQVADWLAASTLRVALTVFGFVLLLFAIGQVVGLDLLGIVVEALETNAGRWLVVAFVGLLLIALALRGFDGGTR